MCRSAELTRVTIGGSAGPVGLRHSTGSNNTDADPSTEQVVYGPADDRVVIPGTVMTRLDQKETSI